MRIGLIGCDGKGGKMFNETHTEENKDKCRGKFVCGKNENEGTASARNEGTFISSVRLFTGKVS